MWTFRARAQLHMGLRTPGNLRNGREYLTGQVQIFLVVVVWTCCDLCQLSRHLLVPSAALVGSRSCPPSPAFSIQWSVSSPAPFHTTHPNCPGQLLVSLAYGHRVLPGCPMLGAQGSEVM